MKKFLLFGLLLGIFVSCPDSNVSDYEVKNSDISKSEVVVTFDNSPCFSDADCKIGVCDLFTHVCVDCNTDSDCKTFEYCKENVCVPLENCEDNGYCDTGVCDLNIGKCVECIEDYDCPAGYECSGKECVPKVIECTSDFDCPDGMFCDSDKGVCVFCSDSSDCEEDKFCKNGVCVDDVCTPNKTVCLNNYVVACKDDGGGYVFFEDCLEKLLVCKNGKCSNDISCEPGSSQCLDAKSLVKCNDEGNGFFKLICLEFETCVNGKCTGMCMPFCNGKECGDDGCGGSCGTCNSNEECIDFKCLGKFMHPCLTGNDCVSGICVPYQGDKKVCSKECGDNSDCEPPLSVCEEKIHENGSIFVCVYPECVPDCMGKECGDDGCGGSCGECENNTECSNGKCVPVPLCGNGVCDINETVQSCPQDCSQNTCGNKVCEIWENQSVCPDDCFQSVCGNGVCEPGENEVTCPEDCGLIKEDCCKVHNSPGCSDKEVEQCVCEKDPYCCEAVWDDKCVSDVEEWGCGKCECIPQCEGKECGNDGCGGICGLCPDGYECKSGICIPENTCGNGVCEKWEDETICPEDCEQTTADCCKAHNSPGCEDKEIEQCVCKEDSFCCKNKWDEICVMHVDEFGCGKCKTCIPDCIGKECGDDGCGGVCGFCPDGYVCQNGFCVETYICGNGICEPGEDEIVCPEDCAQTTKDCCKVHNSPGCEDKEIEQCVCKEDSFCCEQFWDQLCVEHVDEFGCGKCKTCTPDCAGKECGNDGCGGLCGECPDGYYCDSNFKCKPLCTPNCEGKECGDDGCGGSCGVCPAGFTCSSDFKCKKVCEPNCNGKECGDDGCGGVCGVCNNGEACVNGKCKCVPDCGGKECGDNGCGGSCGECPPGFSCSDKGECVCLPKCADKECGSDGCGGSCGVCPQGYFCNESFKCEPLCTPDCNDKECGDNGCGGVCGVCSNNENCIEGKCVPFVSCKDVLTCYLGCAGDKDCENFCFSKGSSEAKIQWLSLKSCVANVCGENVTVDCFSFAIAGECKDEYDECIECTPNCEGKECGDDGCGGSCGECPQGSECQDNGLCECIPNCNGKECGPDGCGGSCGECKENEVCSYNGKCVCFPSCLGKECGDDGCGGSCGECPDGFLCNGFKCEKECIPQCEGKECGPDGCGGACGFCKEGEWCDNGECKSAVCIPDCTNKECGDDGCGGVCGECLPWEICSKDFKCQNPCYENCLGKECGDDGCGGSCGECPAGKMCNDFGKCVFECVSSCLNKECGPDGCGGICGVCPPGKKCENGKCVVCIPNCDGKECGDDGCGGSCGECTDEVLCNVQGTCGSYCSSCSYDEACKHLDFEPGNLAFWTFSGDANVVKKFGNTSASQGKYMLKVSTGMGKTDEETVAIFENCLPETTEKISFKWRYYSEEFLEWCGSIFQDRFTVQLIGPATTFTVLAVSVKELCPPEVCDECGALYKGLTPSDVQFDQGDTHVTPWMFTQVDVTNFMKQNKGKFKLKIFTSDAGDGIYDTVVLVDDINFTVCIPDCYGKECGPDGCGGSCGNCEEWEECDYNTGKCQKKSGCTPQPTPGCNGCECEECVCAKDPFCCTKEWDYVCVLDCIDCGGCQ